MPKGKPPGMHPPGTPTLPPKPKPGVGGGALAGGAMVGLAGAGAVAATFANAAQNVAGAAIAADLIKDILNDPTKLAVVGGIGGVLLLMLLR
jgi:hypothetical protein